MSLQELLSYCAQNEQGTMSVGAHLYNFYFLADISLPCPCCHVPACGLEAVIWTRILDKEVAVSFDRSEFETYMGACIDSLDSEHFAELYSGLPLFIQDWHEGKGWAYFYFVGHYQIDPVDFMNMLKLMHESMAYLSDWDKKRFSEYYYPTLYDFVEMVIRENTKFYIIPV
jgi:hypothetical protein